MLDDIFFTHTAERYRAAPLVEQRERYLLHLKATGARRSTLRKCANDELSLVRLLDLRDGDWVSRLQIEAAAALWAQPNGCRCDQTASPKTRDRFVNHGVRWLAFLGWLDERDDGRHPHDAEVQAFARWLREERGLSDATVQSYRAAADHFFGHASLRQTLDEARSFLRLPRPEPAPASLERTAPASAASPESARRLIAASRPIAGTIAEVYLRNRGIVALHGCGALRFHPRCYYWTDAGAPSQTWPALIAKVTDLAGEITGAHRTWLCRDGSDKAPLDPPRRAMGHLLGHGVRIGVASDVMAAGEGIETMLSLRSVMPKLPVVAALSANHLSALALPPALRRLYIARDNDRDGRRAAERLRERAAAAGVEAHVLVPMHDDLNADLRDRGAAGLSAHLRAQLVPEDAERFSA